MALGGSIGRIERRAGLALLALAMLLRILVPAGWMPAAGQGMAITLCTSMGTVEAWVDAKGDLHKEKPAKSPDQPCAFAGFAAQLAAPDLPLPAVAPAVIALAFVPLPLPVAIGRGLAAPPPPPTGPPASR